MKRKIILILSLVLVFTLTVSALFVKNKFLFKEESREESSSGMEESSGTDYGENGDIANVNVGAGTNSLLQRISLSDGVIKKIYVPQLNLETPRYAVGYYTTVLKPNATYKISFTLKEGMMDTLAPYFNPMYGYSGEVDSYVVYYDTSYESGVVFDDDGYYLLSECESLFDETFIFETEEGDQEFVIFPFIVKDVDEASMTELALQILDCIENVEIKEVLFSEEGET